MSALKSVSSEPSVFDRAARVFECRADPETGARVLCINRRGRQEEGDVWSTLYHQFRCFLEGGRKVLLRRLTAMPHEVSRSLLLDLFTGQAGNPFPAGHHVYEVCDDTGVATLAAPDGDGLRIRLWDMRAGRELAAMHTGGWIFNCVNMLSDSRRAIVFVHQGRPYGERVRSRHYLLTPGEPPALLMEADGFFCSHVQSCPADPSLYAYDRWPSPMQDIEQAIRLRTLDGRLDEAVPLDARAPRPGNAWGARDHYVWTPDSRRIVSYLCKTPINVGMHDPQFNHFEFDWWLSALDWRTGEDLAAAYPRGRWGGHMQMTADSRHIVCCGGPGHDKLFAVETEGLRRGWNERVICTYPATMGSGKNASPFPYPFVLPDQSGVIFNAGWPGPEHGVYLAEWPADLRAR